MATRKAPARPARARLAKRTTKKTEPIVEQEETVAASPKTRVTNDSPTLMGRVVNRKNAPIFLTVLGLVLLGFLAYKYLVVAWVDQTPITKFQLYNQLEKKYGADITEQLITEDLIKNESKKRNVNVSQDEVNAELKKIEEQQGGPQKLDEILGLQKMTRDELESQLKLQLLIEKMFGGDANISDAEINDYIEKNKAQLPAYAPESSESAKLKTDIGVTLKRQKVNEAFRTWLDEQLKTSRIKRMGSTPAPAPAAAP